MFSTLTDASSFLTYLTPPLVGAFIGYLTNRVAIRMLFRPLNKWKIGRMRVPMTPGVIPSKRHKLAENIGDMVGEHLLTGDEISRALQKDRFQEHLKLVIESRISSLMKKDLGSLRSITPDSYRNYLEIGIKTINYKIKEAVHQYIRSETTVKKLEEVVSSWLETLLTREIGQLFPPGTTDRMSRHLGDSIQALLASHQGRELLASRIERELEDLFDQQKSCADILPEALQSTIAETVRSQSPYVLNQAAFLLKDPEIKVKVVSSVKLAIEEFADNFGPMSTMIKGLVESEMFDLKIRQYLEEKEEDIDSFVKDETIEIRVRAALGERIDSLLNTPLSKLMKGEENALHQEISAELSSRIIELLSTNDARSGYAQLVEDLVTASTLESLDVGTFLRKTTGDEFFESVREKLQQEAGAAIQSAETTRLIDLAIDQFCDTLMNRPVGRLDHLIPAGVVQGVSDSLQNITTRMLLSEVPGILKSISIKRIVAQRIDSFDLLRLEKLLLSIMADQFKYINLFGALIGFLIGCVNLIFIISST